MSPKVRRIVRSVKYLFVFIILACIILCIVTLITPGAKLTDLLKPMSEGGMLKDGAWWQMLLLFGAIAVVYPGLVFVKKEVMIEGNFEDHRNKIIKEFEDAGYEQTGEDEEKLHFRLRNRFTRFMRAYEDEVTITKGEAPLILNGNRKEILRLESRITYALSRETEETEHDDPYDFSGDTGDKSLN